MRNFSFWLRIALLAALPLIWWQRKHVEQPAAVVQAIPAPVALPEAKVSAARPTPTPASEEPFAEFSRETLQKLPTVDQVRSRTSDFHRPPLELSEGAHLIAQVENRLRAEPRLAREGMEFYRKCALEESVLTALRAVCLRSLKDWAKKAKLKELVRKDEYSERLHFIADQLPSLR